MQADGKASYLSEIAVAFPFAALQRTSCPFLDVRNAFSQNRKITGESADAARKEWTWPNLGHARSNVADENKEYVCIYVMVCICLVVILY